MELRAKYQCVTDTLRKRDAEEQMLRDAIAVRTAEAKAARELATTRTDTLTHARPRPSLYLPKAPKPHLSLRMCQTRLTHLQCSSVAQCRDLWRRIAMRR